MSLNKKTLYDLVSQGLKQASQKGKSPIGYTVSSYKGVLNALERIKIVYKDVLVQGEAQSIGTRRYSILSELGLGGEENEGFVVHGDDQMSYQAVCDIKEYMSFPTDFTNSEAKVQRIYCPVKRPSQAASQTHILNGYTLQNTAGPTFPMITPSDSFSEDMQTALGEQSNCSVGVGISLSDLGTKFFNRFFEVEGKLWTDSFIETLASRGYLFAEVLLPFNNDTAKVLHSRVTVRHQLCSGGPFEVWLPLPLVLLDDFSALGQVSVHTNNGIEIVNQNNVKFPLRGNKYHHEESYIQNFSPSFLKAYVDGMDEDKIGYKSVNFCNQGVAKRARVRLFFSQDAKQDITKEFGALSQTHNRELFRGQANPDSVIRVEEVFGSGMVYASNLEYWNTFGAEIGLSGGLVERAVGATGRFESGGNWGKWEWAHDTQGISAGFLQFTQLAGGIKDYRDAYKELQANDSSAPAMSAGMFEDIGRYNKSSNYSPLLKYQGQFAEQSKTDTGKLAQIKAWEGRGANKLKRKYTIKWYKAFKCTTACQLMAIFGAINHLPTWFNGDSPYTGKGYGRWLNYQFPTNPVEKAKVLEAIHWIEYKRYNTHRGYSCGVSSSISDPKQFLSNIEGNWSVSTQHDRGHRRRFTTSVQLWGERNADLDGWNTFRW